MYDALTSERVYKKAFSHEKAVEMILHGECGVFNPLLLQCFKETAEAIEHESKSSMVIRSSEREIRLIADEMLRHSELSSSSRTLNLFKHERMKNSFFSDVSDEIFFEYTVMPSTVSFSARGAARLGVEEYIMEPFRNKTLLSVIDEKDLEVLRSLLRETSPGAAAVEYHCQINYANGLRPARIICRAVWSEEDTPRFLGVVGKFEEDRR